MESSTSIPPACDSSEKSEGDEPGDIQKDVNNVIDLESITEEGSEEEDDDDEASLSSLIIKTREDKSHNE